MKLMILTDDMAQFVDLTLQRLNSVRHFAYLARIGMVPRLQL